MGNARLIYLVIIHMFFLSRHSSFNYSIIDKHFLESNEHGALQLNLTIRKVNAPMHTDCLFYLLTD